jgi:hypothetical protein
VLAALLTLALLRKRARLVLGVLVVSALPGLAWVALLRADAPAERGSLARDITATLSELQRQAPWPHGSVQVVREDDDVLFPLGRYALPSRLERPATVQLELRGAQLGPHCAVDPLTHHLVCGAGP